jgi:cytochrome bd-type quinol oxidase subunit 2
MQPRAADNHSRRSALASLAALGSILAASSCCWPVLPFLFAAGTAGSSVWLARARPYLLAVSVVATAAGFYQARRARQCDCKPHVARTILLWFSAIVVLFSILFPEVLANLLAGSA